MSSTTEITLTIDGKEVTVPAGTLMLFKDGQEETIRYWDPERFTIEPRNARDAISTTQRLIEDAVTKQVLEGPGHTPPALRAAAARAASRSAAY